MHAVFRLVKDDRTDGVDYSIRDLFIAMGRQAMHEHGVRRGYRDELIIHLVGRENSCPLIRLVLVAHARPCVGVNRIHSPDRFARISHQLDDRARLFCDFARVGENLRVGAVSLRRSQAYFRSQQRSREQ